MEKEQLPQPEQNSSEIEALRELYRQVYESGGAVREMRMGDGFVACVGDIEDFREALGLTENEQLTQEMLEKLPPVLLFAYPGVGEARVEAVGNAFNGWRADKESPDSDKILYGTFKIAGGEMKAYMPGNDEQKQEWTIQFVRDGEEQFTSHAEMNHQPTFGPDVEDVASLNEKIEQLIAYHGLE